MAVVAHQAAAVADASGDAVFTFPDVPVGELWIGTTTIPVAEAAVESIVTTGGQLVGSMQGNGSYGPWIADHSRALAIASSGMTPGKQYVAVWHADDKGRAFTTYPATITTAVVGSVTIPTPLDVLVGNFPATQNVAVTNTVDTAPTLKPIVNTAQVTMTGAAINLPGFVSPPQINGVIFSTPSANAHPIWLGLPGLAMGAGLVIEPGTMTPVLPVETANLAVIGTAPDVITLMAL